MLSVHVALRFDIKITYEHRLTTIRTYFFGGRSCFDTHCECPKRATCVCFGIEVVIMQNRSLLSSVKSGACDDTVVVLRYSPVDGIMTPY